MTTLQKIGKLIIRYLIGVGVPYTIAKYLEKKYKKRLHEKLVEKHLKLENPIDIRGGDFITIIMSDFALKVGLVGLVSTTIWGSTVDTAAINIANFGKAILAAPGKKLMRCVQKIKGIDPQYPTDIKAILLDKELSNADKMELLRIKIEAAFRQYKGKKRTIFIKMLLALTVFLIGKSTPVFAYLVTLIKELLGDSEIDDFKEHLIEVYYEYNAPLPEELITKVTKNTCDL